MVGSGRSEPPGRPPPRRVPGSWSGSGSARPCPSAGVLRPTSSFADLADLWLADLDLRDLAGNTKENYRTCLRLHVRPAFEHYTLAEVTTGRVEWFLTKQAKVSPSQAKQTRTLLNMLFGYALRHDALARNPVDGTSQLRRAKATPQALTIEQIAAIREAAVHVAKRTGSPRPQARRPGSGHHRGPARHRHAPRRGAGTPPLRHRGPACRDDRQRHRHRRAAQGEWRRASGRDPKTDASIRRIPVPEFAAVVLRRRIAELPGGATTRTIFASRSGGPLSPYNVRRTFGSSSRSPGSPTPASACAGTGGPGRP